MGKANPANHPTVNYHTVSLHAGIRWKLLRPQLKALFVTVRRGASNKFGCHKSIPKTFDLHDPEGYNL
jgi:hypothetical protein